MNDQRFWDILDNIRTQPEFQKILEDHDLRLAISGSKDFAFREVSTYFRSKGIPDGKQRRKKADQIGYLHDVPNRGQWFVKTHSQGSTVITNRLEIPDPKEFFGYKFLELVCFGPQVEFLVPALEIRVPTLYIISTSLGSTFHEYEELTKQKSFQVDESTISGLIYLDILQRILCLYDVANNPTNFGRVGHKWFIIDFRTHEAEVANTAIWDQFISAGGQTSYIGFAQQVLSMDKSTTATIARQFVSMLTKDDLFRQAASQAYTCAQDTFQTFCEEFNISEKDSVRKLEELETYFAGCVANFSSFQQHLQAFEAESIATRPSPSKSSRLQRTQIVKHRNVLYTGLIGTAILCAVLWLKKK